MFAVIVSQAGAPTWRKTFAAREVTIGRSMTNDLVLSSNEVSRQHARIAVRMNVRYTLIDSGSSHGTRYGGQLVTNFVAVMPQVPIEIGPYTLTIERAHPVELDPDSELAYRDLVEERLIEEISIGIDSARLVYADWLEERGDETRAEFLRVQERLTAMQPDEVEFEPTSGRLRQLAVSIEPAWRLRVAYSAVEGCPVMFDFKCPKRWSALAETGRPDVRHCDACHKDVHYTTSAEVARAHAARGACVAFDVSAARWRGDLAEPFGVTVCRQCRSDYHGLDACPRCGEWLPTMENIVAGGVSG